MVQTSILCPGIPTCLDDKQKEIVHYLQRDPNNPNPNLVCATGGCMFMFRNPDGQDIWRSDYKPATVIIKKE